MLTRNRIVFCGKILNKIEEKLIERMWALGSELRVEFLGDPDPWYKIRDIDEETIYFDWEASWSYGGYANGEKEVSISVICDDGAFDLFKEGLESALKEKKKKRKRQEKQRTLAEIKRLKKSLNSPR